MFFTNTNYESDLPFFSGSSSSSSPSLRHHEEYFGRVHEATALEKLGVFASDEKNEAEVTIVLDQPRWTLEDERLMEKLFEAKETKRTAFAPRFSRRQGDGEEMEQQQQQQKHTMKEEIEKRVASMEDSGARDRVRYWNCGAATTANAKDEDERVEAILGDLKRSSKEDNEPKDRVGIVVCGGENKEEDLSLFRALMKALDEAERTFVAGVVGGETTGRVEGSVNSSGHAGECTKDVEKREKRRDLLFSKGTGSQVNECDDLCQLHVNIVSCLIVFWIFAGSFTYGMGLMSNLDTPKVYEKSDE